MTKKNKYLYPVDKLSSYFQNDMYDDDIRLSNRNKAARSFNLIEEESHFGVMVKALDRTQEMGDQVLTWMGDSGPVAPSLSPTQLNPPNRVIVGKIGGRNIMLAVLSCTK